MPNPDYRLWTAYDISILTNLARPILRRRPLHGSAGVVRLPP
jgi:hypothetical protein